MKDSKTIGLVLLLLFSVCAFAVRPLRASPLIGAVVQTWHYDSQTHVVTVRILNTSQKDITAFNLSLKITGQNGVSQYQWSRDLINTAVVLERFKGTASEQALRQERGDGKIPIGGSYDEKIPVQPGLTDFEAVLDVVAFSDKTAEATNTAALQRLIDQRKAIALSIQKADEIVRSVISDSTVTTPHVAATVQVQKLLDAWKAKPHYDTLDMNEAELVGIVQELKQTPPATATEHLKAYIDIKEKERATWTDQAQLVKIGGQQ
jgi:hypothetical protein